MNSLRLALKYIAFNRFQSLVLIACLALTLTLPVALAILIGQFNQQIVARAESTPFVMGAQASELDLTLHALYFDSQAPRDFRYEEYEKVDPEMALAVPLFTGHSAGGAPVVGTSLDYFRFRNLKIADGQMLGLIGDCVVGSALAKRLGLQPGDQQLTDSENITDIAGKYPVRLNVTGILAPNGTADDEVFFVDLKTAWVIEGRGHGHQDVGEIDEDKLLGDEGANTVTSAAVLPYIEFDEQTRSTIHFHGDPADLPLTAAIIAPVDERAATILLGRVNRLDSPVQLVEPMAEVEKLMGLVFQVQRLFNANAALLSVSTFLLLGLVLLLSLRLRQHEMDTMFRIGCSRGMLFSLQFFQVLIVLGAALCILALLTGILFYLAPDLIRTIPL